MKKILIVGAGGCGREVLQWLKDDIAAEKEGTYPASLARFSMREQVGDEVEIQGFLDDDLEALGGKKCSHRVIGTIAGHQPEADEVFLMAIANPGIKEKVAELMRNAGAKFLQLVHPASIVAETAELGLGTVVYPHSVISDHCVLGAFETINMHDVIGHDAVLGDYCTVSSFCDITGGDVLGKRVFLGSKVSIVPRVSVGDDAFLCAGSIVMRPVKAGRKMMGNPAQRFDF